MKINNSFKKIIITEDIVPNCYGGGGIPTLNIYDFPLDSKGTKG